MLYYKNYIYINGKKIPLYNDTTIITNNLTSYEINTLNFCKEWLNNKQDFIIQTSGSTGLPKPIALNRLQMIESAKMTGRALGLAKGDKALICLNTEFIAGIMMLVRCLVLDMEIHIYTPSSNPLAILDKTNRYEFAAFVPLQIQKMLTESSYKKNILDYMKAIIVGGAPVSIAIEKLIETIKAPVYNTYGMTETVSHIALRRLNGNAKSEYFTALENVELKLDDRGCLAIKSVLTENNWLFTNDLTMLIDRKNFKWIGRIDQVINSGGIKIHINLLEKKIEGILYDLDIDNRFFISSVPDEVLGEAVSLFIEGKIEDSKKKSIIDISKEKLNRYEIPKNILTIEVFDETPTGKVDRRKTLLRCL